MNDTRAEFGIGAGAGKEQADQLVGMRARYLALEISVELFARGRAGIAMPDVESSHAPPRPHSCYVRFSRAAPAKSYPLMRNALCRARVRKGYAKTDGAAENSGC